MAYVAAGAAVVGLGGYLLGTAPKKLLAPPKVSYAHPGTENPAKGLGAIHSHYEYKELIQVPVDHKECTTLYETFLNGVKTTGDGPALGYRKPTGNTGKDGKPEVEAGYTWISYNTTRDRAHAFGGGIVNLDLAPIVAGDPESTGAAPLRLLAIMMKNRPEWIIAEQGSFSQSVATVPLYDTLGPTTVEMVVNETNLTSVLTTPDELCKFIQIKPDCPTLKNIILCGEVSEKNRADGTAAGLTIYSFDEVEASGKKSPQKPQPPTPDHVATFLYTSGTTGKSKGAILSHKNIVADVAGAFAGKIFQIAPGDYHLSYLPLAHGFERVVEASCYFHGVAVGFFQGDTLKIPDDLKALRPTLFPSVPRLLNKMYDKVMGKAKAAGGVKSALFARAYASKQIGLKNGYLQHRLWDALVFNKIAATVGLDRCRAIVTGSAPIASHVLEFLRITFKCPVMEGYGQTEITAAGTCQEPHDFSVGNVGGPLPSCWVRLVSVPEMDYLITDKLHAPPGQQGIDCCGRGEICFKGPIAINGYFNRPEQNAELKDADGWVHSGDIGLWLPNGALKIIDRKKNIFKLAQGEYIAPEKIENVYSNSEFVAQSFVYGDSFQAQLVAIIVPDEGALLAWAKKNNIEGDLAALCKNDEVKKMIHADLDRVRKTHKLFGFEHAASIVLEPEPFSLENGMLTPTFKLMRNPAKAKYQADIDAMYDKLGGTTKGVKQGAH
eukprot:TRINITY_DN29173_c0_g1_i1.p1 TRINITY_DN29173_c0_g1~~TRINITY_DN29173_c0_g1_i1.p1  ORF type:complete len:732 (-),score=118.86 TRINITY_DN29173_c0_g1_i1:1944-4106(-)